MEENKRKIEWIFVKDMGYIYKVNQYENHKVENPDIEELPSGFFKQGDTVYYSGWIVAKKYY